MNTEADRVLPDDTLTEILIRLIPKNGERRVVTLKNGVLDLFMEPEAAAAWMEMLERLEALAAEHGRERMMDIYDQSIVLAHTHWGSVQ